MMLRLTLLASSLMAGLSLACLDTPTAYTDHFKDVFEGSATPQDCVGDNLMISIQTACDGQAMPPTLNRYNAYWAWASGPDNMLTYLKFAQEANKDRRALITRMLLYVGVTAPVSDNCQYAISVFQRDLMGGHIDVTIPTWDNLFTYLTDFEMCPYNAAAGCADETIVLDPAVREELRTLTVDVVTGCTGQLDTNLAQCNDECLPDFCEMQASLVNARNQDSTRGCVEYFSPLAAGADAAEARAYFDVCMGCNELFTGRGVGNDGTVDTGVEYLVRGDVPLVQLGNSPYHVFP